jgi:hypothetical protein
VSTVAVSVFLKLFLEAPVSNVVACKTPLFGKNQRKKGRFQLKNTVSGSSFENWDCRIEENEEEDRGEPVMDFGAERCYGQHNEGQDAYSSAGLKDKYERHCLPTIEPRLSAKVWCNAWIMSRRI